jgi:hypothetical protein
MTHVIQVSSKQAEALLKLLRSTPDQLHNLTICEGYDKQLWNDIPDGHAVLQQLFMTAGEACCSCPEADGKCCADEQK